MILTLKTDSTVKALMGQPKGPIRIYARDDGTATLDAIGPFIGYLVDLEDGGDTALVQDEGSVGIPIADFEKRAQDPFEQLAAMVSSSNPAYTPEQFAYFKRSMASMCEHYGSEARVWERIADGVNAYRPGMAALIRDYANALDGLACLARDLKAEQKG